jgi:hypothetical protein
MNDELLERATRALSSKYTPAKASSGADLGLRRLVGGLATARVHRARLQRVAIVAAASFIGLTAWATASGRLPQWLRAERLGDGVSPVERAADDVSAPPSAPEVAPLAPSADFAPTEEVAPPPILSPRPRVRQRATDAPVKGQPGSSPLAPEPDLDALYRDAHDAHFVRRDPAAALVAWDRYIAAAGANGRMTLEARYNRAVMLVRLGKTDQARNALEPFARGEFGGYRRDDAARLLESLR